MNKRKIYIVENFGWWKGWGRYAGSVWPVCMGFLNSKFGMIPSRKHLWQWKTNHLKKFVLGRVGEYFWLLIEAWVKKLKSGRLGVPIRSLLRHFPFFSPETGYYMCEWKFMLEMLLLLVFFFSAKWLYNQEHGCWKKKRCIFPQRKEPPPIETARRRVYAFVIVDQK